MNDLLRKLKALGIHIESAATLPERKKTEHIQEIILNGKWVEIDDQRFLLVEELIPYGFSHGDIVLQKSIILDNIRFIHHIAEHDDTRMDEIAFLDVETSSLSYGSGTIVFLIGICSLNHDGIRIVQIFLDDPINEPVFINYLDNLINDFKLLVTYNGKTFDIPLLKTRFALNKIQHPFDNRTHLDLLTTSRKIWRLRLESRSLSSIENQILNFHRNQSEVPGWLVPQIYYDFLQTGDFSILNGVFYHNKMDILSLAALFQHIIKLVSNENMILKSDGLDIFSIANLLNSQIESEKAIKLYEKSIEKGIPDGNKIKVFRKIAAYYKKNLIWEKAIILWEHSANLGDYFSCIELAKFYEHRSKEIEKAIFWVDVAEQIGAPSQKASDMPDLTRRKDRLLMKSGQCDDKN